MSDLATADHFPDTQEFNDTFHALIEGVNGFVYQGGDLETCVRVLKWLRVHPEQAVKLLPTEVVPDKEES